MKIINFLVTIYQHNQEVIDAIGILAGILIRKFEIKKKFVKKGGANE